MSAEAAAAGPPLLLVHGWGSSAATFAGLAAALADRHRVLVPDLPGHGTNPPLPSGQRVPELVAALDATVAAAGGGPVVAVGHSLGGQIVTGLALRRPSAVCGLVVLDPAYGADDDELRAVPHRAAAIRWRGPDAAYEQVSRGFSPALPRQARAAVRRDLHRTHPGALLDTLESTYTGPGELGSAASARRWSARRRVPVLALYSSERAAEFERSLDARGPLEIAIAPGPGHYLHLEHPAWVVDRIRAWLGRWPSAAPDARP